MSAEEELVETRSGHDPGSGARWVILGPAEGEPVVKAWADGSIPFDDLLPWQRELRGQIRTRCRRLPQLSAGQLLHATFFGSRPPRSDVENLLLYNVDESFRSFEACGRNGIRFGYSNELPSQAPGGTTYQVCMRYELRPRDEEFAAPWRLGRPLASLDWVDLGAFAGDKKLALVWLALARAEVEPYFPVIGPDAKFAVRVQVRPPRGQEWVLGKLVKPIFDGVICALQAHTDKSVLPQVVERLAEYLPAFPEDLMRYLLDQSRAVLRPVDRLVATHGMGVKWYPSDDLCMAGELLPAEPTDDRWALKAEVLELIH